MSREAQICRYADVMERRLIAMMDCDVREMNCIILQVV